MPPLADLVAVGRIVRPHGIRGELKVQPLAGDPAALTRLARVYLPVGAEGRATKITGARVHHTMALLTLEAVPDRNAAEALAGTYLYIEATERQPLGEDEYYLTDLIGLTVVLASGDILGELTDVFETGANDVYEVKGPTGTYLIPATAEVVKRVDLSARRMEIDPLPGLLELGS